eukprot:Blabericola_migrator_1__1034@NODE_1262_length_4949_cov_17_995494_g852_i0_p2_GENE_NODE_1262_length_4949_cov_17_995494_g852_i0NODE_1262_length_4949_cov_17_995494_g852_i0_p2_ORF_typecomplete_len258_score31_68Sigma54_CBD/PF04963_13/2_7Sigma54_CBD/PF04963_13/94_NODE_1262_length_4949_cov_17_995494_g852_i0119892
MTYPRSVTFPKFDQSDVESESEVLPVILPHLCGPHHLPDMHHGIDRNATVAAFLETADRQYGTDVSEVPEAFRTQYDSLVQELDTEGVLPNFQDAIAEALEEIKGRSEQTTVEERLTIMVEHVKEKCNEADLTSFLERVSEATSPSESWFRTLSGWARRSLGRAVRLGAQVASSAHYLLPFVALPGMVDAMPIPREVVEVADEATYSNLKWYLELILAMEFIALGLILEWVRYEEVREARNLLAQLKSSGLGRRNKT